MYDEARKAVREPLPDGPFAGTHFMGRFGAEAVLFRLVAQLEEARPWKDRRPPVYIS